MNEVEEHRVHDPNSHGKLLSQKLAELRDFVVGHVLDAQYQQKEYNDKYHTFRIYSKRVIQCCFLSYTG